MEKNLDNKEAISKLKNLAEEIKICMLATSDTSNNLYGRPMTTMEVDDNGTIWFFTADNTKIAQQAAKQSEVCLNYAHPGKNSYLTVQGNAELVNDKEKMKQLWTPMLKTWFPDGVDDPSIALLKVTPTQAHYWDSDASRVSLLFAWVKANITGDGSGLEGKHGDLNV